MLKKGVDECPTTRSHAAVVPERGRKIPHQNIVESKRTFEGKTNFEIETSPGGQRSSRRQSYMHRMQYGGELRKYGKGVRWSLRCRTDCRSYIHRKQRNRVIGLAGGRWVWTERRYCGRSSLQSCKGKGLQADLTRRKVVCS